MVIRLYEGYKPTTGPGSGVPSFVNFLCSNAFEEYGRPGKGESVAVVTSLGKTAALCHDRVFSFGCKIPDEVSLYVPTRAACIARLTLVLAKLHGSSTYSESNPETFAGDAQRLLVTELNMPRHLCNFAEPNTITEKSFEALQTYFIRTCCEDLWSEYKIAGIPVYSSSNERDAQYGMGDHGAIVSYLKDLEIVDEENTRWEQVLEFRKDQTARLKYRRFIHWLDSEMVGKSASFVEDAIAIKLEDYRWALRKHGIRTFLGAISATLDPKYLLGTSAVAASMGLLTSQPLWALLTQGGLMVGKACVSLARAGLDFDEVRRGHNSEVAFVYEAQKRINKPDKTIGTDA